MSLQHLLYKNAIPINDYIQVRIPTVAEVLENEEDYYSLVSMLTATPYDMMVQLDDMKIDFTELNDYELFLLLFNALKTQDTSLIFGSLDLNEFSPMVNLQNNMMALKSSVTGAVIDRSIHYQICRALRTIHHLERNNKQPANAAAKEFMLQRARTRMKRHRNKESDSQIEDMIVALVNTEQFSYNYETVLDLSIYQFNRSLQQIVKKIDFDNKMHGIYGGTISAKDLNPDDLVWFTHK